MKPQIELKVKQTPKPKETYTERLLSLGLL
jgi:hypothetical protein